MIKKFDCVQKILNMLKNFNAVKIIFELVDGIGIGSCGFLPETKIESCMDPYLIFLSSQTSLQGFVPDISDVLF